MNFKINRFSMTAYLALPGANASEAGEVYADAKIEANATATDTAQGFIQERL